MAKREKRLRNKDRIESKLMRKREGTLRKDKETEKRGGQR